MLPDEVVEKIRAKETAQLHAKAGRTQKRSEAERLAEVIRREQLRQIPRAQRSNDEQREFARLEARRYRQNASKKDVLSDVPTAEKFWEANRLLLPKTKLNEYLAHQSLVEDQLYWMAKGWECSPQDPDFVSLEEGLEDLDRFVSEHGLIHDDCSVYQHYFLRDYTPQFAIWCGFWKNPELFNALCNENEPTRIFAKYGIRIALSAAQVRLFKHRVAEHQRARAPITVPGLWAAHVADVELYGGCWLCRFEALHGGNNVHAGS